MGSGISHQIWKRTLWTGQRLSSTNRAKGLVARRLFRVPPYHEGTNLQTTMFPPGFELRSYGTAVSVSNEDAEIVILSKDAGSGTLKK
ncbi:hypothetical protein TNCV_1050061 [Trichonephila clavipes]|nr:hypothetical protein TNCV_1050061 [Trichonephila clavipes]